MDGEMGNWWEVKAMEWVGWSMGQGYDGSGAVGRDRCVCKHASLVPCPSKSKSSIYYRACPGYRASCPQWLREWWELKAGKIAGASCPDGLGA